MVAHGRQQRTRRHLAGGHQLLNRENDSFRLGASGVRIGDHAVGGAEIDADKVTGHGAAQMSELKRLAAGVEVESGLRSPNVELHVPAFRAAAGYGVQPQCADFRDGGLQVHGNHLAGVS